MCYTYIMNRLVYFLPALIFLVACTTKDSHLAPNDSLNTQSSTHWLLQASRSPRQHTPTTYQQARWAPQTIEKIQQLQFNNPQSLVVAVIDSGFALETVEYPVGYYDMDTNTFTENNRVKFKPAPDSLLKQLTRTPANKQYYYGQAIPGPITYMATVLKGVTFRYPFQESLYEGNPVLNSGHLQKTNDGNDDNLLPDVSCNDDDEDCSKVYLYPEHSHGTHVAGIVASRDDAFEQNDHFPIAILPVKIDIQLSLDDVEDMTFAEQQQHLTAVLTPLLKAIDWATGQPVAGLPNNQYPAKVINMSLGVDRPDLGDISDADWNKLLKTHCARIAPVIERAVKRNTLLVFSAGNGSADIADAFPVGCRNLPIIVVEASQHTDNHQLAEFSNYASRTYGPRTIIVRAPGEDINSTVAKLDTDIIAPDNVATSEENSNILVAKTPNGMTDMSGTSMAAPDVAGILAIADWVCYNLSGKHLNHDDAIRLLQPFNYSSNRTAQRFNTIADDHFIENVIQYCRRVTS